MRVVDLYLLVGQSNMQGYAGDGRHYPRDPFLTDLRVRFFYARFPRPDARAAPSLPTEWHRHFLARLAGLRTTFAQALARLFSIPPPPVASDQWTILGPQWGRYPDYGHFGPEVTFGRRLTEAGMSPAIMKYARESASLAEHWLAPGEGGLYDDLVETFKRATSQLVVSGFAPRLRVVIWIQGESDAKDLASAQAYLHRLEALILHFRRYVAMEDVPFILGAYERNPSMLEHPEVLAAQTTLVSRLPCVARSSMAGLPAADWTHLTPEGVSEHGDRLFETYRSLARVCKSA